MKKIFFAEGNREAAKRPDGGYSSPNYCLAEKKKVPKLLQKSRHTNLDDLFGGTVLFFLCTAGSHGSNRVEEVEKRREKMIIKAFRLLGHFEMGARKIAREKSAPRKGHKKN